MKFKNNMTIEEAWKVLESKAWQHSDINSIVIPALCIAIVDLKNILERETRSNAQAASAALYVANIGRR